MFLYLRFSIFYCIPTYFGVVLGLGRKRAVSPLIATLLLVLISIAASTLVYLVVSGYLTGNVATAKVGNTQIVIDAASCQDNKCTVYVRNVGSEDIPSGQWSLSIYSDDRLVDTSMGTYSLKAGQIEKLEFSFGASIGSGSYKLKLTTPTGTFATVQVKIP